MATCRVRVGHPTPMVGAHWVEPVGWVPANRIAGSEYQNGAWKDGETETAGIAYFTLEDVGSVIEVPVEDLRVAACEDWEILEDVVIAP